MPEYCTVGTAGVAAGTDAILTLQDGLSYGVAQATGLLRHIEVRDLTVFLKRCARLFLAIFCFTSIPRLCVIKQSNHVLWS